METMNGPHWFPAILIVAALSLVGNPAHSAQGGTAPAVETIKGQDGAPMVLIPAGSFTMGTNDGLPNERPEHTVTLDAYYIDLYEVTMTRYGAFLEAKHRDSPPTWDEEAATAVGDRPAVGIKWTEAAARSGLCRKSGGSRRTHP